MLKILSEVVGLCFVMCAALVLLVLYVGEITIGKVYVVHDRISDRDIQ